jgi:hypothetical protein
LDHSDVVALIDDGSLRRWRKSNSGWQEISRTKSTTERDSFRLQQWWGGENRGAHASTLLGYNDALAVGQTSVYFGVGQILQQLVSLHVTTCLIRIGYSHRDSYTGLQVFGR